MVSLTQPRKLVLLVCAFAAVFLLTRQHLTDLYYQRLDAHTTVNFDTGLDVQYGPEEWGLRGRQTEQLIAWGEHVIAHPSLTAIPFLNAMLKVYPFLGGALEKISMPWTGWASSSRVGIVMSVGNGNARLACHLIANLRYVLNSKVPIVITYAGDKDLGPKEREIVGSIAKDIQFIDLVQIFPTAEPDLLESGWASKPFAMLAVPFPKVILVDADAIFISNPDTLFDTHPGLQDTGALFYHDRASFIVDDKKQTFLQEQLDAAGRNASWQLQNESLFWAKKVHYEADSGLVALDKSRVGVFLTLVFSTWMNTKQVRDKYTHPIYYGDKEAYWIAMELAGAPYTFPPWYAGSMGTVSFDPEDESSAETFKDGDAVLICGKHMLHADHSGQRPFWFNGGIYEDKGEPSAGYAELTHWWMQPERQLEKAPSWSWMAGNRACLKEKGTHAVNKQDARVLERIIEEAKKIDERHGGAGVTV